MYFKYGTYRHPNNEVNLASLTQVVQDNQRGGRKSVIKTMSLEGQIKGYTGSALGPEIYRRELAYDVDYQDAGLYHDDGTVTDHYLSNSKSISGVRVKSFNFANADGAEYATLRTFQITLEAEYLSGSADGYVSYTDTLDITGTGGPQTVVIPVLRGPPIRQLIRQQTPVYANQSGQAVGYVAYPIIPRPIFPQWERLDRRRVARTGPTRTGTGYENYTVRWSYMFESTRPLYGYPTIR